MSDLRKALRSLPKDLDETYARILQDIDNKGYGDQVAKILQWLAYSAGRMSLNEIAEVLTVDMESDPLVDFERRLEDPQDILEFCSSLVSIGQGIGRKTETLQFAHFSVREFLESPRLDNGPARKFAVDKMRANILIAESCIAYNIQVVSVKANLDIFMIYQKYPLSIYAQMNWNTHARIAREDGRIIFLCERAFRLDNSELSFRQRFFTWHYPTDAQGRFLPLHYALYLSLPRIMRKLILEGAPVNLKDTESGQTPLMLATFYKRVEDVQFLLDHGAEVNTRGDRGDTALMDASKMGCIQVVLILLDKGADLEAQNERGDTALLSASRTGHTEIVHLLLGRGASIDSPIGEKALVYASRHGYSEIVQIFLDRGVNVEATCDLDGTALLQALASQHYGIADLLVENGADANARSFMNDRDAVLLEHIFVNDEHLHMIFRAFRRDKMFRYLIAHGADPKLVRTHHLNLKQKKLFRKCLSEVNIELSLE